MSGDLAGFLLARLAEDEALARREPDVYARWNGAESEEALTDVADIPPGRLLAEVEAKREIVGLLIAEQPLDQGHWEGPGSDERWVSDHAPKLLRLLALPYAGHPDYCEEWRP